MRLSRDAIAGLSTVALGVGYWLIANAVPASLLADQVGADGVPKLLASALVTLGAVLALRGVRSRLADAPSDGAAHRRAFGLLVIGCAYVVVMPVIGFLLTTAALIVVVAVYAGRKLSRDLVVVGAVSGVLFWATFAKLLGIAMPSGILG
jgi:hypothetical protein